jgi:D-tyrosyl-tRNA(Tyr) deacylase
MIGLLQRVSSANVAVDGQIIGQIDQGLLVLIGVQQGDASAQAERLLERLLAYRVFADAEGRMNLNIRQVNGGLLLVPQFTLAADTSQGNRAGFSGAAEPALARSLFGEIVTGANTALDKVGAGRFGANMDVSLVNQGPVTFWLEVPPDR